MEKKVYEVPKMTIEDIEIQKALLVGSGDSSSDEPGEDDLPTVKTIFG